MNKKATYAELLAENKALQEEIRILRQRLGEDAVKQTQIITDTPNIPVSTEQSIQVPFPNAKVTQISSPDDKIELFMSLFRGRSDVYAKRWHSSKSGQSGYSPVCLNEWVHGLCDKKKYKCAFCPNRNLAQLSHKAVFAHLSGKSEFATDVIGIYPMTKDEGCYFLAIDFDGEGWQKEVTCFRATCAEIGLDAHIERSRSGNGAHVWFFFDDEIPAATARKFGSALLTETMARNHQIKFDSYDRLFPNQDIMPKGGFGNLIALPLQGLARKSENSIFVDEIFVSYADQWAYLSNIKKLSPAIIDEYIAKLCKDGELGTLHIQESDESDEDNTKTVPWEKSKSPSNLTPFDFPGTVTIVKANMLHIEKAGISARALNRIKRLGAFSNPDFYKAQAMRLTVYGKPRIIDTTEETAEWLSIPRGCEDGLVRLLEAAGVPYCMNDKRNHGSPVDIEFAGVLREEQELAAEALLNHENGVLHATTAFGKTVVAAGLISKRKTNTLILVHTTALLRQWKESLSQFLLINETLPERANKRGRKKDVSIIGLLGGGKNTLSGKIDIAIMQSLVQGDEVKELVKDYGMVIVDECHHVSAVSFEKVLKSVNARYVYGLTATPTRQDGHESIIHMQCGAIRYRASAIEQAEKSGIQRLVVPRFTSFKKPLGLSDREFNITAIYAAITENRQRNSLIVADVLASMKNGRTPIVLTQRTNHVQVLADALEGELKEVARVIRLTGSASAKEKREVLEKLRSIPKDERFVIVATGKYVGEGFDEPRLDTLFLAAPISWKGTLQQYAGRLHRTHEGKTDVVVYDYIDAHVKMLESMYHKRITGYASMGYKTVSDTTSTIETGVLFDNHSFLSTFAKDIEMARHEIVICSPFLRNVRVAKMMKILSCAQINRVRVVVLTRPAVEYKLSEQPVVATMIQTLTDAGYKVITKSNIHQKFAVIDQKIAWYGSINLMSFGTAAESIMRLESIEISGELLDGVKRS